MGDRKDIDSISLRYKIYRIDTFLISITHFSLGIFHHLHSNSTFLQGGFNKEQHLSPQNGATPSINGSVSEMELSDEQIAATSTSNHSVSEMKVSNEQAAAASIISSISSDLATEGITETFLSSPLSESQKVDTESNVKYL